MVLQKHRRRAQWLWLGVLVAGQLTVQGRVVKFDNQGPRLDNSGAILDAHDGTVQRFTPDGPYYMHAVAYGMCRAPTTIGCDSPNRCGFRLDHNISVYTSEDLSSGSWTFRAHAMDWRNRPPGTVFRPAVVHNPNTDEYVLWWNYVHPNGTYAGFAAATSASPLGPFETQVEVVPIRYQNATIQAGDFHLFVDTDGTGYVLYSAGFYITIEKLRPDLLGVTGEIFDGFRGNPKEFGFEAPVMFKRQGLYYIMFGPMCCFCYQGSGIRVYTSRHPLGPYTYQGQDLACVPQHPATPTTSATHDPPHHGFRSPMKDPTLPALLGKQPQPTPGQGCLFYGPDLVSTTRSQQNFVIEVATADGGTEYVWTGDRWMQSPDGIKGHEPQFWAPLRFDEDGNVLPVEWIDDFTLDTDVPVKRERLAESHIAAY